MNWLQQRRQRFLILLLTAVVVFILDFWNVFQPWRSRFQTFLTPIKKPFYRLKSETLFKKFTRGESEQEEQLKELQKENSRLQGDLLELAQIQEENKRLRQLLQAPLPQEYAYLPAYVASQEGDYLWITKGEADGVFVGQLAVIGGQLVGEVAEIKSHQAKILSLQSARFRKPVVLFSGEKTCLIQPDSCQLGQGILQGGTVRKILRDELVEEGNWVGLLGGPGGILVGQVTEVSLDRDKVFQQAQLQPSLDIHHPVEIFLVYPND